MALASLVLSACLQGCATTPTVMDKADPVAISSTDPRYSGYLRRVHELIRTKMSYPCVKDEATSRCDYKPARLTIEFSLLQDGQIDYVRVAQKAEWEVFDEYSVSAIRRAAPFPPVPPALMAQAKPGSAGVRILVSFEYRIVDPNLPR